MSESGPGKELFTDETQERMAVEKARGLIDMNKAHWLSGSKVIDLGDKTIRLESDGYGRTEAHFIDNDGTVIETQVHASGTSYNKPVLDEKA